MSQTDANGIEWVRVKDTESADGRHLSVPVAYLADKRYSVLDKHDALDQNGRPLAPKYAPTTAKPAAAK